MKNKNVYSVEFSFVQTITGEAFGESEEEVKKGLEEEFSNIPEFTIISIKEIGPMSQYEMNLEESTLQ